MPLNNSCNDLSPSFVRVEIMILLAVHMAYGHKWILNVHSYLCSAKSKEVLVALTENEQRHFQRLLAWLLENISNTALTIVCTINVSIDCNVFDVSNPLARKNIHKWKSR